MAGPWFVRSLAVGAGTGADWANAFTTLTAANTASTAGGGETFWIADDHAESTAGAVTLTSKGVTSNPNFYYCVDHTVASPGTGDLKTTGVIANTGANNLTIQGFAYFYGVKFNCGSGAVAAQLQASNGSTVSGLIFEVCQLALVSTGGSFIILGASSAQGHFVRLVNTTVKFGATGQSMRFVNGPVRWEKTASAVDTGGSIPTTLMGNASNQGLATVLCEGVDFSAITGTLVAASATPYIFSLVRCKLGAGVVVHATPTAYLGSSVDAIQCDSGATNYFQARYRYVGTLTQETTIIRSGGASDGTTPISWKLVSTANSKWVLPFESFPIPIWNDTTGVARTMTVEIVAAGSLNNDDIWLEVEYLGDASSPQASFANNTKANNLATGTALPASSAIWASSPGSAMTLAVTFTPQMKGYLYGRVYVAKPGQTVYVDWKVDPLT